MEGTQYLTKEDVLKRAQEAIGIPMRDIDRTGRIATGKGAIGNILEEAKSNTVYADPPRAAGKRALGLQYDRLYDRTRQVF